MAVVKLGDLTTFTGSTDGAYLVINDSTNTATYKVQKEGLMSGSFAGTASFATTASYSQFSVSSSFSDTASYIATASYALTASLALDVDLTGSNGITKTTSSFELGGPLDKITNIIGSIAGNVVYDGMNYGSGFLSASQWREGVAEDPVTGKVYVGGYFSGSYSGQSTGFSLIRLNSDLTKDLSFDVGYGVSGSGFFVKKILVDNTINKIYVGGRFLSYNGTTVNHIMRLNQDGTIDPTFNTGGGFSAGTGTIAQQGVWGMALDSQNKLYVVGSFRSYSGSAVGADSFIVKINQDGTKDTSFNNSTGFNGVPVGITIDKNGKLLVLGVFFRYKGVYFKGIVRLNTDGSIDYSFNPGGGFDEYINSDEFAYSYSNDTILVGGSFTTYSGSAIPSPRIVRINSNGTIDNTFNGGTGFSGTPYIKGIDYKSRYYVGITTNGLTYNGTFVSGGVVRLNYDGTIDSSFNSGVPGMQGPPHSYLYGFATSSNQDAFLVGAFSSYNGLNSSGIVKVKLDSYYINLTGSLINYSSDNSLFYTSRSLIDKGYLDTRLISITGSLFGTSSWSSNALTASYVTGSIFTSSNPALTASFSLTASYITGSAFNSSNPALSSSFAATASSADTFIVRNNLTGSNALFTGTITAQTLNVQIITSSTDFITGSTRFGSQLTNTHQFTGSVSITGSLAVAGPVNATSSWSTNALTASYVPASAVVGLSLNQISTGSVEASVNLGTSSFQVISQSSTLFSVSNTGNMEAQSMVTQQFTASDAFITNLNIQTLTASIVAYTTGSTIFGDAMTDTHQFTGSVTITGSLQINGNRVVDEFTVIAYSIAL